MSGKVALITGITGQDGSYLAEFLLKKEYRVYGLVRRLSSPNRTNVEPILGSIEVIDGDLMDQTSLNVALARAQPDEIYNLAAQSFVGTSFRQPVLTGEITGLGTVRLLEAMRAHAPHARLYQASSSEMFGHVDREPQSETTPFHPRSPYGVAKVYAYWASVNYREAYDLFVSNGILFNHESPRRGMEFVTRKIVNAAVRIHRGLDKQLKLGNLDAKRDWGYSPEYVNLMWRTLQHSRPEDFVGATGESHTVREFVEEAFAAVGITDWQRCVVSDDKFVRPAEVYNLRGDASKARSVLGWEPRVRFKELVRIMVEAELQRYATPAPA